MKWFGNDLLLYFIKLNSHFLYNLASLLSRDIYSQVFIHQCLPFWPHWSLKFWNNSMLLLITNQYWLINSYYSESLPSPLTTWRSVHWLPQPTWDLWPPTNFPGSSNYQVTPGLLQNTSKTRFQVQWHSSWLLNAFIFPVVYYYYYYNTLEKLFLYSSREFTALSIPVFLVEITTTTTTITNQL